jgi:hypothetical protein
MLKKSASFVLVPLRGSTYGKEYDSPLRSLRPRWTAFLSILLSVSLWSESCLSVTTSGDENSFAAT